MSDVLASVIRAIIGSEVKLDLYALYPCEVLHQHGNGLLDVRPEHGSLNDHMEIPIWHGLPGVQVEVNKGARALLGWHNADASKPYISLWQPDSLKALTITADTQIVIDCGDIRLGSEGVTKHIALAEDVEAEIKSLRDTVNAFLTQVFPFHTHPGVLPGPSITAVPAIVATPPAPVGSTKSAKIRGE